MEIDEMMVEDAGLLSEVQEEITLGEEGHDSQLNGGISLSTSPAKAASVVDKHEGDSPEITLRLAVRHSSEEIAAPTVAPPTPAPKSRKVGQRKTGRKQAAKSNARTSLRRGRSAGSSAPAAKAETTEDTGNDSDEEEAADQPEEPRSEEIYAKAVKPQHSSPPKAPVPAPALVPAPAPAPVNEEAPPPVVAAAKQRQSGRSSRKKIDPDFCYDDTIALTGGRSGKQQQPVARTGAGLDSPVVVSSSAKSVVAQPDATSKALPDEPSSSSSVVVASQPLDSLTFTGSPAAAAEAEANDDDEAKVTGGPAALADDVSTQPAAAAASGGGDLDFAALQQKKAGKNQAARKNSKSLAASGSNVETATKGVTKPPKLYCICKKPYDKRFMIECDKCEEWFHGSCVDITKKQGEKLVRDKLLWLCPRCKEAATAAAPTRPAASTLAVSPAGPALDVSPVALRIDEKADPALGTSPGADPDYAPSERTRPKSPVKKKRNSSVAISAKKKTAPSQPPLGGAPVTPRKTEVGGLSPRKGSDSKESPRDKATAEARPKDAKSKHLKVEEKPPVESDSTGLVLTALGKSASAGTRTLRNTQMSRQTRPPPLPRSGSLFEASPKQSPRHDLPSPHLKPDAKLPTAKPLPATVKPKPRLCMVCKKHHGRENSLYCSSECIMRHGMDALELVKVSPHTPADRIAVSDKQTGATLTGQDAPLRTALLAFLESHQGHCVNIPSGLLQAKADKAGVVARLDTVRESTRMMLKDHLLNRWKDAEDLHTAYPAASLAPLATSIEIGLFDKFKEPNSDYKKKYRAIVLNINDKKNENFFRRLIKREIPPEEVADLTQEQMASDSLTQWRQEVERKELDLIIQTQMEEQQDQRPVIKKTHRGDEFFEDEIIEENESRPEQQPNLETGQLTDPSAAEADDLPAGSHSNFSPAVLLSPSDTTMKSPNYSFNTIYKMSPGGTPSSVSPGGGASHPRRTSSTSPDQSYNPSPGRLADASDELLRAEHKSHIFDIGCKFCTNSFASTTLSPGADGRRGQAEASQSPRSEPVSQRRVGVPASAGVSYSSPSSGFKAPTGDSTADRKRKLAKVEDDVESPVSSTSDYSPNSADEQPEGVIWQGEVDTKDLPAAKLQAFTVFGKAAEFMAELPGRLDQLGRIQPNQLWPYLEQVKPLKDIALVVLKGPPGRMSSEFHSLHYFLTTRGRVSVLGPLPHTFKDFYLIALKENEPLPESLCFPEGVDFDVEHSKIFIGIIVHHRSTRPPPSGRSIFEVPTMLSSTEKKPSPYPSPKSPDEPTDNSPATRMQTTTHRTNRSSDPIVNRFLAMEGAPAVSAADSTPEAPDMSEPMDIDDDAGKTDTKIESIKKMEPTEGKQQPVSVPDLLKLVKSLPSKTQAALGLAPPAAAVKSKVVVAPPVDPRLSRLNQSNPVAATEVLNPSGKPHPIQINLAIHSAPGAPPSTAVAAPEIPAATTSTPLLPTPESKFDGDMDSLFSKKFIENLAKIEFPEGLKEALRSIAPSTSSQVAPPPETIPKPSLLGPAPDYSLPPPAYYAPPPARPPPIYGAPPSSARPQPFPPTHFSTQGPPPRYHHEPAQHAAFGERFPPRDPGYGGENPRWNGPPQLDHQQHRPPPQQQFNQQQDQWNRDGRNHYPPQHEFRGGPDHQGPGGGGGGDSRWGDRPPVDRDGGAGRRHTPPPRDRDRRDTERHRRRESPVSRRPPPAPRTEDTRTSEERDRIRREEGRPPIPPRRRSRSRSPVGRNRRDDRTRRRGSRERASAGARKTDEKKVGLDEFGRDMSLRRQLSGSRDRDSLDKIAARSSATRSDSREASDRDRPSAEKSVAKVASNGAADSGATTSQ